MKLRFGKAKTIFAYIACLMVFLGVAEAYMRFKGYIPALDMENNPVHLDVDFDPDLGWAAMPGTHFQVGEPEPNELFTNIWHDGQRQSRWLVKRGGHKRVLLVGCSYTFGNGVRSTETYPWLLNERFPEINFDNFAFPAYGTFQALLSAEKHLNAVITI